MCLGVHMGVQEEVCLDLWLGVWAQEDGSLWGHMCCGCKWVSSVYLGLCVGVRFTGEGGGV